MKSGNTYRTINKIEAIRKQNNIHWMGILRLAMEYAPDQTRLLLKKITKNDEDIGECLKKL